MPTLITDAWRQIGASETVLKWVEEGVPLQFDSEPHECWLPNRVTGRRQEEFVNAEIAELVWTKAVRKVRRQDVHCILPLRCVPKNSQS